MPATGAMVELLLGTTWTDVTARTYLRDRITITRGRQDQGARVDPGSATITFNNKGGYFSPKNPLGPLYGLIGRNTPVRISAAGGAPWLALPASPSGVQATTPDAAPLRITGDLDIRLDFEPDDWYSASVEVLIARYGSAGNRSWRLQLNSGFVQLSWSADGTSITTASMSVSDGFITPRVRMRVTLDVDNGAGGYTARFYTGPTLDGPWTQFGASVTGTGTTSVFAGTAPVSVGNTSSTLAISVYGAQVRSSIDGTVVAAPDFTAQTVGATSFTDSIGRVWTAPAGSISNRRVRFLGEISSWPARWDVSGGDVYTSVQAAGIMRRLGQGSAALDSTLRRRITGWPTTVAYWPFEDGSGATQAYSPTPGVQPAAVVGAQMAADDSLGGSLALPSWPTNSGFTCPVPSYPASTSWQVQHVYRYATGPSVLTNMLTIQTTGTVRQWQIAHQAGYVRVRGSDNTGTLVVDSLMVVGPDLVNSWTRQRFTLSQSGGTVTWTIGWTVVGVGGGSGGNTYSGTSGQVTSINQNYPPYDNLRLGHIALFSDANATAFDGADTGFSGENASQRYIRLNTEEGVPWTAPYGVLGTSALGPQRTGSLLDLLEEAAEADVDILYESRNNVALAHRPRRSLYNQTPKLVLDYNKKGEVAPPLEPVEDDTATRNDVIRSRPAGSSARVSLDAGALSTQAPPLGVGRYQDSATVNVAFDSQLLHVAGWALRLGTWDEARYPSATVNLAAGPWLIGPAMAVDLGDLISIVHPPPWLPPDDIVLMVQGYTEVIGVFDWLLTYNCTPGNPWTVGVLDTPANGQLMSAGSTLAAGVSSTATTFSVATTSGAALWTTNATRPADFPLNIRVGGEVMTVGTITGTSSPQTFSNITRSVNGIVKPQTAGTAVQVAVPFALAL